MQCHTTHSTVNNQIQKKEKGKKNQINASTAAVDSRFRVNIKKILTDQNIRSTVTNGRKYVLETTVEMSQTAGPLFF